MTEPAVPLAFPDVCALDAWLTAHPAPHPGLWVQIAKKGSGVRSVTAADVNDVALCHGWITGQRKGLDDTSFLQRITPRRPGSLWSAVNVRRVERLTAAGRMRPAGLAEVAAARADGRWAAAYASQQDATVPAELAVALERSPRARVTFGRLGRTDRYLAMLGVLRARSPEQRSAQVAAAIAKLEDAADAADGG
ncbi:YdeI/OmpD-associated family protein [Streptomyces bobili]|uniref:YdeI/OmpD-associated family protein n=1 Tax=Streptomyces bobili TaxID=67280 RepID=UPI002250EA67|nr:YdeI/OmpD-associated family protein [Streptomyces bobili]MCX5526727.1 YdeI/OmpD-associated family protein [Streptomyces bobili]